MHDPQTETLLQRLLQVVRDLYAETQGLSRGEDDLQLWYNRGYADAMVRTLREQGYGDRLPSGVQPDASELIGAEEFLPWGKAYRHGFEMGEKETREAMSPES